MGSVLYVTYCGETAVLLVREGREGGREEGGREGGRAIVDWHCRVRCCCCNCIILDDGSLV